MKTKPKSNETIPESPKHESFALTPPAHTWPDPRFKLNKLYASIQRLISAMGKRTFNFIELETSPYLLNTESKNKSLAKKREREKK